ncbi:interleukin-10 receptor subunit beta-like isoform 2-T2 [Pholidichthys leucotaenia]
MSACVRGFILTVCVYLSANTAVAMLAPPTNVHLSSYNLDLVLRWGPANGTDDDITYTAEYRSVFHDSFSRSFSNYTRVCENSASLLCDFSRFITVFGTYQGRVKAQRGDQTSVWVESNSLTPDKHATIGPPSVSLTSTGTSLEVLITEPRFTNSHLRDVYGSFTYNISYWKSGEEEQVKHLLSEQQNRPVLQDLDPETEYCVRVWVQVQTDRGHNPTESSEPVCRRTLRGEEPPWVIAVVMVVVAAAVVTMVILVVVYWRPVYHFLFPRVALPDEFKEFLSGSSGCVASEPVREVCDQVSVVAGVHTEEEQEQCPLEANGRNHSCDFTEEEEE